MTTSMPAPGKLVEIHAGFLPLTDCAPLAIARELRLDRAHGVSLILHKEASWANIRDKIDAGYLDCAIALAPMPLAATLGLGGRAPVPSIAVMATSLNGNAITVSRALFEAMLKADPANARAGGMASATALARVIEQRAQAGQEPLTLGMVHPFSCHNYDLRYWLGAAGIDPDGDINLVVVPPPLIAASLKSGRIDGFCVGEPWSSVAVDEGDGVIVATKADLWALSPEKVLMLRKSFADERADATRGLIRSLVQACEWADQSGNKPRLAEFLSQDDYVGVRSEVLLRALLDKLQRGHDELPKATEDMIVFSRHHANFPWRSHARWILTQMIRWGQVRSPFEICDVADAVYRTDLYRSAIESLGTPAPQDDVKPEDAATFFAGERFDPGKPADYIAQHAVRRKDIDPHLFSRRG